MKNLSAYISEGIFNQDPEKFFDENMIGPGLIDLWKTHKDKFIDAGFGMYNLEDLGIDCKKIDKSGKYLDKKSVIYSFQCYPEIGADQRTDLSNMWLIAYDKNDEPESIRLDKLPLKILIILYKTLKDICEK